MIPSVYIKRQGIAVCICILKDGLSRRTLGVAGQPESHIHAFQAYKRQIFKKKKRQIGIEEDN